MIQQTEVKHFRMVIFLESIATLSSPHFFTVDFASHTDTVTHKISYGHMQVSGQCSKAWVGQGQ